MSIARLSVLTLSLAVLVGACAMRPVQVDTLSLDYPSPMIANKVPEPLYVVVSPDRVPDSVVVRQRGLKDIEVNNVRSLVTQHVPTAMRAFFSKVVVIDDVTQLPAEPHFVADVEVRKVGVLLDQVTGGGYTAARLYGTLTWSVGMRHSTAKEYGFTYAASVRGLKPLTNVNETSMMYGSTVSAALGQLNKALMEGGLEKLVSTAAAGTAPTASL